MILGLAIHLIVLNPIMGLLAVASLPVNVWLLSRFRHRLWGLSWAELNERAEVTAAIDEPVRGLSVVRAFGREDHERERVAGVALRTYRFAMSRYRMLARYDVVIQGLPVAFQSTTPGDITIVRTRMNSEGAGRGREQRHRVVGWRPWTFASVFCTPPRN